MQSYQCENPLNELLSTNRKDALANLIQQSEAAAIANGFTEKEFLESIADWLSKKDLEKFEEVIKSIERVAKKWLN